MRIFFSGDENAARWHLPVAQAKVGEFVKETEKSGLKQNRFTFLFKETGAIVHAQYVFGQVSMQIHAPSIPMVEEVEEEIAEAAVGPKTFWVNTTQGYFWVEVRYTDGVPRVILTPFEAISGEGFIYPGFALTAPGMISGSFDDTPESRFVLSQNGGVMSGAAEGKGTVQSIAIIDNASRLTVLENNGAAHDFVLIQNVGGKEIEMRRVGISYVEGAISVERKYASINMAYEGQTSLHVANLSPTPAWIHRKCNGSYFSPNKTIGYHVDIGTDDNFLGNIASVRGADLLDNTGGFVESLFNHTPDLYRIAGLLSFPVSVDGSVITVILVSPSMGFVDDPLVSKKCWGGYGLTQDWASCVDYMHDFGSWLLSPRFVVAQINLSTAERNYSDIGLAGSASVSYEISSWDRKFGASVRIDVEHLCNTDYYNVMDSVADTENACDWSVECSGDCGIQFTDTTFTGECPQRWTPYKHWEYFSRENLRVSRRAYFLFGNASPEPSNPSAMHGFYLLFDGLWHLDIGVIWTTAQIVGNSCGICTVPIAGQDPGALIYFHVTGSDTPEWILEHGHEYVSNLNVIEPLGYHYMPNAGGQWATRLGFIAEVPEEYDAPHEPVVLIGGVEYIAPETSEVVKCQRKLMSEPCICSDMAWDSGVDIDLGNEFTASFSGGCPPFDWSGTHVDFLSGAQTTTRSASAESTNPCVGSLIVVDACNNILELSKSIPTIFGSVVGPNFLAPGDEAYFTHDLTTTTPYTGTLELVSISSGGAILRMPEDAEDFSTYTASWQSECEQAAKSVYALNVGNACDYDAVSMLGGPSYGAFPGIGAKVLVFGYGNCDGPNSHTILTLAYVINTYKIPTPEGCGTPGLWYVFKPSGLSPQAYYFYGTWPDCYRQQIARGNASCTCP